MTGIFDGTKVESDFAVNEEEARFYIGEAAKEAQCDKRDIASLDLHLRGNNVSVDYTVRGEKFERIRRITGYLVGTIDRWNNGKLAELSDRVMHA